MKQHPQQEGRYTEKGRGLGTVTEAMVEQRARELALLNGRSEKQVLDSDWEQARRELTGEQVLEPPSTPAEQVPEESRMPGNPGSTGGKTENVPAQDEQIFAEQLVHEGAEGAEHETMVEATRESLRRDTGARTPRKPKSR